MFIVYADYHDFDDFGTRNFMIVGTEEKAKYWVEKAMRVRARAVNIAARRKYDHEVQMKYTRSSFERWKQGNVGRICRDWKFGYEEIMVAGG